MLSTNLIDIDSIGIEAESDVKYMNIIYAWHWRKILSFVFIQRLEYWQPGQIPLLTLTLHDKVFANSRFQLMNGNDFAEGGTEEPKEDTKSFLVKK